MNLKQNECITLAMFILVFVLLCSLNLKNTSLTADEISYTPVGIAYFRANEYSLNYEHPPLIKQYLALPLLILNPKVPMENGVVQVNSSSEFGRETLFALGNDADQLLFWARAMNIFLGIVLGLSILFLTHKVFGKTSAYGSLIFFCFSSIIIANSQLATLDIGLSLLMFLTVVALWNLIDQPSIKNYWLLVLVTTLALLSKYPAMILLPIIGSIYLILKLQKSTEKFDSWVKKEFIRGRNVFLVLFAVAAITLTFIILIMWADYGFETVSKVHVDKNTCDSGSGFIFRLGCHTAYTVSEKSPFFPTYFKGLVFQSSHNLQGHSEYFLGRNYDKVPIVYFLVAFLIKTEIPILILFISSIYLFRNECKILTFLLTPILILFAYFSIINNVSIGIRYLLPMYPFIFVLVGGAWGKIVKKRVVGKVAAALLIGWFIIGNLLVFPYYLAYFNEAVGGSDKGYRYLLNSNLDWGQDVILLKGFIEERGIDNALINYYGPESLEYRGIRGHRVSCFNSTHYESEGNILSSEDLKSKDLFISLNQLYRFDFEGCWASFRQSTPNDVIGKSIFYFNASATS